jgi:nitrate reductase gamma subunit
VQLQQQLLLNFNRFLPRLYIDYGGLIILTVLVAALSLIFLKWREAIPRKILNSVGELPAIRQRGKVFVDTLASDVFYQKSMADCSRIWWVGHLCMFWGFVGLAATTTLDEIINPSAAPLPLISPVRILGNFTGAIFLFGVTLSLVRRAFVSSVRKNSRIGDAIFLGLLFLVGVSGFVTEYLSDLNMVFPDSLSYYFHIILVTALLATAPFTKFVHAIGRPVLLLIKRGVSARSS